jgi:hypothetical protein
MRRSSAERSRGNTGRGKGGPGGRNRAGVAGWKNKHAHHGQAHL